jgi:hypothetical protein
LKIAFLTKKTKKLLAGFHQQEEEMRQNMEELAATQEQIQRQEKEININTQETISRMQNEMNAGEEKYRRRIAELEKQLNAGK